MDPPLAVGKHGVSGLPAQQSWLTPPLASMHRPWASWLLQALPAHVALHGVPLQLSSWTGTPVGSPGCAVHGFGPVFVWVPVVSRSLMFSVPASWLGEGGQPLE